MVKKNNILFKMTLREIKNNFKQYIALLLISFLAITLFVGLSSNASTLQKRVDTIYQDGNMADIYVYVNNIDAEDKNYISNLEAVENIEERLYLTTTVDGYNANMIIAKKDNVLSTYSKLVGDNSKRGFLIDKHYHDLYKKQIGDDISFSLPVSFNSLLEQVAKASNIDATLLNTFLNRALKEGVDNPFNDENIVVISKVTGLMEHPEAIEVSSSIVLTALLDQEELNELFIQTIFEKIDAAFNENYYISILKKSLSVFSFENFNNQYLLKVKEGFDLKSVNREIHTYFQDRESDNLITSLTSDNLPTSITLSTDVNQARQLSIVFPAIFFVVAILVVLTTLSQLIFRSKGDIGTMKAIGLSKWSILKHYIFIGMFLCLIGCILGSIVGPLIIPGVLNNKYNILYVLPSISVVFPMKEIILCTVLFTLLCGFVSFLVSYKEVSLKPVEATRLKGRKNLKTKKIIKNDSPLTLSIKMIKRNIFANLIRTLMVTFGVMGCTALLVSGFGIMDTVNYGVNLDFTEHDSSDLSLTYQDAKSEKDQLLKIENVDFVQEYMIIPLQAMNDTNVIDTTLQIMDYDDGYCFDFIANIKNGVALPTYLADKLNVKENDTLTLIYKGKKISLNIDCLFSSSYLLKIYTSYENLNLEFEPSGANIVLKNKTEVNNTKEEINQLGLNIASLKTNQENQARIKEILSSIEIMCNTIKVFAILLSIVVTYNLALLNFNDRKRDIATLKVLGCNNKEIVLSLVGEILLLTLVGCILGLFLGYPLLVLILRVNQTELFHFLYHIYLNSYALSVVISLGTSLIVNFMLSRLSRKVDAVSALKSVE